MAVTSSSVPGIFLGPLTTVFVVPTACAIPTVYGDDYVGVDQYQPEPNSPGPCFPSVTSRPIGSSDFTQSGYFSPGICPSGWTSFPLGFIELVTTALCCPPGFTTWYYWLNLCTAIRAPVVTGPVVKIGTGTTTYSSFSITATIYDAVGVQIRYKSDDFNPSIPSASPTTSTSSSVQPSPAVPDTGLSTGAKIGLGTGIPGALIFIGIIVFIIIYRRRHTKKSIINEGGNAVGLQLGHNLKAEMPGSEPKGDREQVIVKAELDVNEERRDNLSELWNKDLKGDSQIIQANITDWNDQKQPNPASELPSPDQQRLSELDKQRRDSPDLESGLRGKVAELASTTLTPNLSEPASTILMPSLSKLASTTSSPSISELPSASSPHSITRTSVSGSPKSSQRVVHNDTGPLQLPPEIFPSMSPGDAADEKEEHEDLEYQAQRLRERREFLAERERLAVEEHALREKMKKRKTEK